MPSYELSLALRAMPKTELKETLKRISNTIFGQGGIIRNIENLGFRKLPYKTSANGMVHHEVHFYLFKMDTPSRSIKNLREEYRRDVDIVRQRIFRTQADSQEPCTLEEELLPPAYRKEVQKMIEIGKIQQNPFTFKFKYNSGFDYYPFQK
ncbi:Probable 28S ribosomal protein S6, mitochondrial [Eumeta japonica]|uniref:Small ribosomal subunit protein bS6m n=1 Tax=Eumeta variegata TaxID=151549 RepID=A0A4C1XJB0_EUMVA|nr:Probable 28S ribosomal protein S6, mitochondrial [Eumeta japonica]